jgi:hypothetical protein
MRDNYKATSQLEMEIAKYLYERHRGGHGPTTLSIIRAYLKAKFYEAYGMAVLEPEDLVRNLHNRKLVRMDYRGGEMSSKRYLVEWTASELDSIMFLSGL